MKKQSDIFSDIKIKEPKHARKIYLFISAGAVVYWFISIFAKGFNSRQINLFYIRFGDFLADFVNVVGYSAYSDPYNCTAYTSVNEKGYPPLTYVLMQPFAKFVDMKKYYEQDYFLDMVHEPLLILMFMIFTAWILIILFNIVKSKTDGGCLEKNLTAAVFVMSAPVVFTIERGNILLLAFVLVMIFVFYYNDENAVKKELALISLGFAFGLKLSPALFGILLLFNKQYKEAVRTAVYGLLFLFVPFLFLKGGLANISTMLHNVKLLAASYADYEDCSLRYCLRNLGFSGSVAGFIGGPFRIVVCMYLGACCVFCKRRWEKAAVIALIMLLVPIPSHYYCLLYLMPALLLFLNEKQYRKLDWIALISFIVMFTLHKPFLIISQYLPIPDLNYNTAEAMLILLMMYYGTVPMLVKLVELRASKGRPELLKSRGYLVLTGAAPLIERRKKEQDEVKKKKAGKIRLAVLLSIFVISLSASIYVAVNPDVSKDIARWYAVKMYEDEEYEIAAQLFESLEDYRDCPEYLKKCEEILAESGDADKEHIVVW